MFVIVGFDMVPVQRMGKDNQDQSDGNSSMLQTWLTDFARDVVTSYRGSELTRGSETLILMIGLPSVLHQDIRRRKLKEFRAVWCWLTGCVHHGPAPLRFPVVEIWYVFAQ